MIRDINNKIDARVDKDVGDAYFLHNNQGWKPEDLGYPPGDYIILDLMRQFRRG